MINAVAKSGNLSPYLKATAQVVVASSNVNQTFTPVPNSPPKVVALQPKLQTTQSLQGSLPINAPTQVRLAHTDITIPDFSDYRRDNVKSPSSRNKDTDASRKTFTYLVAGAGGLGAAYSAKTLVNTFVSSMAASADVLALAKIEVKLADIPEGKNVTLKWRGKPLFIKHRTPDEIADVNAVDTASLRDPQADSARVQNPEWLVVLGVCTHLGCVPIAGAGDYHGGYYCPCHGSHYDAAGRIRKGPAPLNLEVPYYEFQGDILVVG